MMSEQAEDGRVAFHLARTVAILLGLAVAVAAAVLDQVVLQRDFLEKSVPDLSAAGIAKSILCLTSAGLLLHGIRPRDRESRPAGPFRDEVVIAASFGSQLIMFLSVAAILAAPAALNWMVNSESSPMGVLSEILLAAAVVLLALCGAYLHRGRQGNIGSLPGSAAALIMAAVVLLIFLEEISWGQHLFGWRTPEAFSGNIQSETNIHNFYTNRFEVAYYLSAILAFIVLPWAWPARPWAALAPLTFYVPPAAIVLVSAPLSGYLYLSWNIVPLQIGLFAGLLVVLSTLAPAAWPRPWHARVAIPLAATLIVAQIVYLRMGERLIHVHEVDELREFQISLLIFLYAAWLLTKASQGAARLAPRRFDTQV